MRRAWYTPVAVAAVASLPALGLAQQPAATVATRALLIEQAERAVAAGDHRAALALAERAGRIEMTPSLRMLIAQEQLAAGAPAAAMASALTCVREAMRDPSLPYRENVLARCRDVGQRARSSVALVVLRPPPGAPDARVELDDQSVPPELLDVPQPVDPGAHSLVVRVPARRPRRQTFEARAGETLEVALEAGEPEPPATPAAPATAPVTAPERSPVRSSERSPVRSSARRPRSRRAPPAGAVALVVAGGASLVAAGVFFALRGASAEGCAPGPDPDRPSEQVWLCDDASQVEAVSMRGTWTALAGVTAGVGAAALGVGVAWWLLGRPGASPATPSVALVPGGALLSLEGAL